MPAHNDDHGPLAEVRLGGNPGAPVATVLGELDMSNASEVHRQLLDAAAGAVRLVVDLSTLAFIDSAGIAILDRLNRDLATGATELAIAATPDSVAFRTLRLAGMDGVLPMTSVVAGPEVAG